MCSGSFPSYNARGMRRNGIVSGQESAGGVGGACLSGGPGRGDVASSTEQQLDHLKRRALCCGVEVQRQSFTLRKLTRFPGQLRRGAAGVGGKTNKGACVYSVWAQLRAHFIRCGDSLGVGAKQQLHHLERRAFGRSVVQR